jgi:hypothetical protein
MAICDGPWTMTLVNDDRGKGSDDFVFREIRVTGTTFTGEVWDRTGTTTKLSLLTGTCEDLAIGDPRLWRITFQFSLPGRSGAVGMFLAGVGFQPSTGNAQFKGRFRAFTPDDWTPHTVGATILEILFDVGDTGTGNGMQAMP